MSSLLGGSSELKQVVRYAILKSLGAYAVGINVCGAWIRFEAKMWFLFRVLQNNNI